uniref:Uncharacterized protein n=1 Tax=Timema shepardi TaxID=629360 RepID=A0A7R9B0L5_TIMSH|nr:unnamed protein product [Timema shepardi]
MYESASQESDPGVLESEPPVVLSSPSAPQEEDSPKAELILPSTKSQEAFKDSSDEVSKDPSELPQESPPTHRDSVAESSKPQNQSFELTTSL